MRPASSGASRESSGVRPRYALIGAAGNIAGRHLQAIAQVGGRLVAAVDPHDAVGVLDRYSLDVQYFREIERFERHLQKLRHFESADKADYVAICSPNYLHDAHCRLALRAEADAICEKPLVINPWNLDLLESLERETGRSIFTVLQLRHHSSLAALRASITPGRHYHVDVEYLTARGAWYHSSWKGDAEKSGGIAVNIGVHVFDVLLWLFGPCIECRVHRHESSRMSGQLELEAATVDWSLSLDPADLPADVLAAGQRTYRRFSVDGELFDVSQGFEALHTVVYEEILAGRGLGLADARPAVELTHRIRTTPVTARTRGGVAASRA
jgi:UDP-N-acetyl-2-amino-2-deoxyglucuronate dehydrogenase